MKSQATSVDTGSQMKDDKLKSKDFFNVDHDPLITFHSTKIVQTGSDSFDVPGTFTIRGVSKPETLTLTVSGKGTGSGEIKGTMAFDRKDSMLSRARFPRWLLALWYETTGCAQTVSAEQSRLRRDLPLEEAQDGSP